MRKLVVWMFVITMIAGSMTACGSKEEAMETAPTAAASREAEAFPAVTLEPENTDTPIGHEDTYWVADAYFSQDGEDVEGPVETYQMVLYHGGGIVKLNLISYG